MVGRLPSLHLRRICLSHTTILSACRFDLVCSISSTFSAKLGRWEDIRFMGSSGGALNKWQQRRLEEKRAINKLKKGKLLGNSTSDDSNSYKNSKNSAKEGYKDQISAPADKFMKVGAVDLWNENDGPLTTVPPLTDTSKVRDSLNGGKVQRKDTVKDGSGKGGSIGFRRGFSSLRRFNGLRFFMKAEELDDGVTINDSLGKRESVMFRRAFSRGFNTAGIFSGVRELDGRDTMDNSLGKSGSVLFRKCFSSGSRRRFKRVGTSSEDEELDEEWYGDGPFDSVGSHTKEEDTGFSSSKSKSNWRKGREFERLGSFGDEEETGRKIRKNSAIPKSLIDDEMELDNIIDKEMTAGMKFEEELLTGKRFGQFYDNDKEAFRRSRFLSMVDSMENFSDPRSREDSSDEEDERRESRFPKPGRVGGSMRSKRQFMSGSKEELSNSSRNFSRWRNDDGEKVFRQSKPIRMGESTDAYSGHKSRERFFNENEGRRVSRNPKTGRIQGPTPAQWGSRSKRQSMGSFDKTGEMGFREIGSNRRGRSFSSFSGVKRPLGRDFDFEKEIEFTQPKPSGTGDFMSRLSVQKSRRESLREKAVSEDKESRHGHTVADDSWLKFGSRFKSEASRDMEMSEDKEEELDTQTLPREFCKTEQPNGSIYHAKNYRMWNGNEEKSYLSSLRFDQCNISTLSLQALSSAGYVQMTVMQESTLPIILEGYQKMQMIGIFRFLSLFVRNLPT
ncbi:uncharacterized protein LOC131052335 isoform X2 [Cryptomeria japonica]|uniref:uncharacterized protein LOC131052335 isoform X2 n=1 Tax=Cryptomeria japonica TaxID=3369 RepID=UPI0027DA9022|nr:uncharacterized protein LOC131052335 isoform X2 [Cryptomeria japonica]